MSNVSLDRLSAGYDLSYLEQIKYAIRSMPYGDLMKMSEGLLTKSHKTHDIERWKRYQAKQLWDWANEDKTKEEQTAER